MSALYHFTSLKSLESILKNRTIRFSSLAYVNDKYEGETQDIGNLGQYIFVSCWTSSYAENLSLWDLYADHHHGVRIELELPIFKLYYDHEKNPSLVPHIPDINSNYTLLPTEINKLINKIHYSNNHEDIKPKTLYEFWDQGIFDFGKLGKWKSKSWKLEEESRFIIYSLPIKWDHSPNIRGRELIGKAIWAMQRNEALPIRYIDIPIEKNSFDNMKIMKGRKMTCYEKNKCEQIISLFNPKATICSSSRF